MEENTSIKVSSSDLAAESTVFVSYLKQFGLPTDNIIASTDERHIVGNNIPLFLNSLPNESKENAKYLSKFVGAAAVGLFDAALNYMWNEVVLNLRKKACVYGVDLFFDAAVGGRYRENFNDESDLDGLKDIVLLNTCKELELISDIVHRKLDFILTMRNEVAASHPNVENIGGYELLGWLQTCVKEVLDNQPSASAIHIRKLVHNLKSSAQLLDSPTVQRIESELENLSLTHSNNLLITTFGIFVDQDSPQTLRVNISKIAPKIWKISSEEAKLEIGAKIDSYRTNLYHEKLEKGITFLRLVDGLEYETIPAKIIALDSLAEQLKERHEGWDNFHTEPTTMKEILAYCKTDSNIPREVQPKLIKTVIRCRIGKGIDYKNGVSSQGLPLYDKFFGLLGDKEIEIFIKSLFEVEIKSKLRNDICSNHIKEVLSILKSRVISERLKEALLILINENADIDKVAINKDFRELTSAFLNLPPLPSSH